MQSTLSYFRLQNRLLVITYTSYFLLCKGFVWVISCLFWQGTCFERMRPSESRCGSGSNRACKQNGILSAKQFRCPTSRFALGSSMGFSGSPSIAQQVAYQMNARCFSVRSGLCLRRIVCKTSPLQNAKATCSSGCFLGRIRLQTCPPQKACVICLFARS